MGSETGIGWTRSTLNWWMVCTEKSEACAPCYARTLVTGRLGHGWGEDAVRIRTTDNYRRQPYRWNAEAARTGAFWPVFCFSLADWADGWVDRRTAEQIAADMDRAEQAARARGLSARAVERQRALYSRVDLNTERASFFRTVEATPALTYQLLTKRAEHVAEMVPGSWLRSWPQHAWIGVTTENATQAALRLVWMLALRRMAAVPVVFASAEPLYSAIDYERLPRLSPSVVARRLRATHDAATAARYAMVYADLYREHIGSSPTWNALEAGAINWVISGGQSAGSPSKWLVERDGTPKPEGLGWVRDIRDACARWDVAFFHKQWGGPVSKSFGKELDGREHCAFPAVAGTTPTPLREAA